MRQLLAILGDSFRQSVDRKVLLVLLVLALLPIVFCFGMSFESQPIEDRIQAMAGELNRFTYRGGLGGMSTTHGADFTVGEVRRVGEGDGWPPEVRGGYTFDLTFSRIESVDGLARSWGRFKHRIEAGGAPRRVSLEEDRGPAEPVSPEERTGFLEDRFGFMGFQPVHALADGAGPDGAGTDGESPDGAGIDGEGTGAAGSDGAARFRIALGVKDPLEIPGAHRVRMLFGLIDVPLEEVSVAELVLHEARVRHASVLFVALRVSHRGPVWRLPPSEVPRDA